MKRTMLARLLPLLAISTSYMSDPTDSAAAQAPQADAAPVAEPTKESLIARMEALIEAGYADIKQVLSDGLTHVEQWFGHGEAANASPAGSADASANTTGSEPPAA